MEYGSKYTNTKHVSDAGNLHDVARARPLRHKKNVQVLMRYPAEMH